MKAVNNISISKQDRACTLSILVARPDVGYMMQTIPHLVKMCNFAFYEKVLVVDCAPLPDRYESQPSVGSLLKLKENCQKLVDAGVMDRVWEIDYSRSFRQRVYAKHFHRDIGEARDWRGYPNLGTIGAIEEASTKYIIHFDADMLLYQSPNHDWISSGIELLDRIPDLMFVSPLSGPPSSNGSLKQGEVGYTFDERGFYSFSVFTSRKYLLDKDKLNNILPLTHLTLSWKRRLLNWLLRRSSSLSWEMMISRKLMESPFRRADLASGGAWTLHTPDHGSEFLESLPLIISMVEQGQYPASQGGDYDLRLADWKQILPKIGR